MSMILRYAKHLRRLNGVGWRAVLNQPQVEVTGVKQKFYQRHSIVLNANLSYATSHAIQQELPLALYNITPMEALETRAKRYGRVSKIEITKALNDLQESGMVSSLDILLLIRCCGRLFVEGTNTESINLVQEVWDTCLRLKLHLDVSHFNALLNVYLEKDYDFSPSNFITKMLERSIEPNRITYQRLITAYCKKGDIAGATKILEVMKEKDLPLCESIFNSLITGHSQANDLESARNILDTMKNAEIPPSTKTYEALMCAYAKHGDLQSIETTLEKSIQDEQTPHSSELLEVFYTLAVNGHADEAGKFADKHLHSVGLDSEIGRVLVKLVNSHQIPLAMNLLLITTPDPTRLYARSIYILKAAVKNEEITADVLIKICKDLGAVGSVDHAFRSILFNGYKFDCKPEILISLLKAWRDEGGEIRTHYFWPILRSYSKQNSYEGLTETIKIMVNDFELIPCCMTLREYVLPYMFGTWQDAIVVLKDLKIPDEAIHFAILERLLVEKRIRNAAMFMNTYPKRYPREIFLDPLVDAFIATKAADNFVKCLQSMDRDPFVDEDNKTPTELIDAAVLKIINTLPSYANQYLIAILYEFDNRGLSMSPEVAVEVKSFLQEKMTPEINEMMEKLSSGKLTEIRVYQSNSHNHVVDKDQYTSQQALHLRRLFYAQLPNADTEQILYILESMDKIGYHSPSILAQALSHFCACENIDAAKMCVSKIKQWGNKLDTSKVVKYATLLVKNKLVNDAIDYLSELKDLEDIHKVSGTLRQNIRDLFDEVANTLDVENLHKIFNILKSKNFVDNDNYLLNPLIRIHIDRNDLEMALSEFERVCKEFQCSPLKTTLTKRFIEMENANALQKITDVCTEIYGESNALTDLAFAFLACDRPRQAQKIFETPGLQVRNDRISGAINWLRMNKHAKALEQLPKVTRSVRRMDQSFMFGQLLNIYDENNDWQKGLGLWTDMQETEIHPSAEFLPKLKKLLERNGQTAPFVVNDDDLRENLQRLITKTEVMSKKHVEQAEVKKRFDVLLSRQDYNSAEEWIDSQENMVLNKAKMYYDLIEKVVGNGDIDKAIDLLRKVMKNYKQMKRRIVIAVASELKNEEQLKNFIALSEVMDGSLEKILHFPKATSFAYIKVRGLKYFLENTELEPSPTDARSIESMIHFGGVLKGLLAEPDTLPLLEAKAYKLIKQKIDRPIQVLWNYYLIKGSPEAMKLWNQFVCKSSSPLIMPLIDYALENKDPSLIRQVGDLIKDQQHVSLQTKILLYVGLMKIYNTIGDYDESLKVFQYACAQFRPNNQLIREMKELQAGLRKSKKNLLVENSKELDKSLQEISLPGTIDVESPRSKSVE